MVTRRTSLKGGGNRASYVRESCGSGSSLTVSLARIVNGTIEWKAEIIVTAQRSK